jgi:nuclear transport factor 2 (NTF2) superfamily protein
MNIDKRNAKAAEIVKAEVKWREEETMSPIRKSWRYTDFVDGDRFLYEIKDDKGVHDSMDADELAEYAIDQIYN